MGNDSSPLWKVVLPRGGPSSSSIPHACLRWDLATPLSGHGPDSLPWVCTSRMARLHLGATVAYI